MLKRLAMSAVALLCVAGSAAAAPLDLPTGTPLYFQFNNLEQVNASNTLVVPGAYAPAAGMTQGNWGVLNISSIQFGAIADPHVDIGGGPVFWSDDGPGGTNGQITGIFYGVQLTGATTASGGVLDLFWSDAGSDTVTNTCLANTGNVCEPNAATVAKFTAGTFLARLNFASGIVPGDPVTTISSSIDPTTIGGGRGSADSFANVDLTAGGSWASVLNGDWFDTSFGTRDVRFSTFFNGLSSWDGPSNGAPGTVTRGLRSNDPARVVTAPEPATVALFGLALAGLAARQRRKVRQ
jgi:hypothetical protein